VRCVGGPGSSAIDELCCREDAGGCFDLDGVSPGTGGKDWSVGAEVDGGGADGGEQGGSKLTGIETVFVKEDETVVAGSECWEKVGEVFGAELGFDFGEVGREGLQGDAGLEGDADAGQNTEAVEEGWVEVKAKAGERAELGRGVWVGGGEHAGSGGGGFGERGGAVKHCDTDATVMEFEGKREADDAGPGDADVGVVHGN
jgi:hypothetical protein